MADGKLGAAFMEGFGGALPGAALGLLSLPFNLMESGRQREFQKSAQEAQLAFGNYQTQQEAANRLMGMYAQAGENAALRNFTAGYGADLDFMRQLQGERKKYEELLPKKMGLEYEAAKRSQDLATNPAAKELLFQNFLDFKRKEGVKQALAGEAMFGPTAFSRSFTV